MNSNDTSGSGLLQEIDQAKPFMQQLQHEASPVVLINTFIVPDGKMNEVLAVWRQRLAHHEIPAWIYLCPVTSWH